MILPADYQNIICKINTILESGIGSYESLIYAGLFLQDSNRFSDELYNNIVASVNKLFLFNGSLTEIDRFILSLNRYIEQETGNNIVSFIVANDIKIPNLVNQIFNKFSISVPVNNIGLCVYNFSSSSSSFNFVNFVKKLYGSTYSWNFNDNFVNNSLNINQIEGLKLDGNSPVSIVSILSPVIILNYNSSSYTNWSLENNGLLFQNNVFLNNENGTII